MNKITNKVNHTHKHEGIPSNKCYCYTTISIQVKTTFLVFGTMKEMPKNILRRLHLLNKNSYKKRKYWDIVCSITSLIIVAVTQSILNGAKIDITSANISSTKPDAIAD